MTKEKGGGNASGAFIDGVEYPSYVNFIGKIRELSPCLLSNDDDALKVRQWLRENNDKCIDRDGWVFFLLQISFLFTDDKSYAEPEIHQDFLEWKKLSKSEKRKEISNIQDSCRRLVSSLAATGLPLEKLKVRDASRFIHYWFVLIERKIDLGEKQYMHGSVAPWSYGRLDKMPNWMTNSAEIADMPIVVLLETLDESVGKFLEFDSLNKPANGDYPEEIREFARNCSKEIMQWFRVKQTPNEVIASLVALKYRGCGVVANDVKNWKR